MNPTSWRRRYGARCIFGDANCAVCDPPPFIDHLNPPLPPKGTPMITADYNLNLTAAQTAVAEAERQLAKARIALQEASKPKNPYGEDPYDTGAILRWSKQYTRFGTSYSYAALKIGGGRWVTTVGTGPGREYTWDELAAFIKGGGAYFVSAVYHMKRAEWECVSER